VSAQWINARARNVVRRPLRVGATALAAFLVALLSLVAVPRRAQRAAAVVAPTAAERKDTTSLLANLQRDRARFAAAESSLAIVRARLTRPVTPPAVDTLPPDVVIRRDSLAAIVTDISRLLARVEQAPLAASYRALADAPAMRSDVRVKALVDSLADVERERDAFGAVGGIDPNYVALTARATEIGRAIQEIAESKRSDVRRQVTALTPPAPPPITAPVIDTVSRVARRDSLRLILGARLRLLDDARRNNARVEARAQRARDLANVAAPPLALLAAALVLGLATGFGATLVQEMRAPRVADAREAERATGLRVLARIQPYEPAPERVRRRADQEVPPLLESGADAYRFLYLHASSATPGSLVAAITGRHRGIAAVVAANVAATAALDARAALLVDADPEGVVAGVMRVRPAPGMADIASGDMPWAEAPVAQVVGRDRSTDVITAGARPVNPGAIAAAFARDLPRLVRRYDTVVVTTALEPLLAAPVLPLSRVIYCLTAGETTLAQLVADVAELREMGAQVLGLVLWDRDEPHVPTRDEVDALFAVRAGGVAPEMLLTPVGRGGR
jgi:Mrp family chromosome partitioning ATPase